MTLTTPMKVKWMADSAGDLARCRGKCPLCGSPIKQVFRVSAGPAGGSSDIPKIECYGCGKKLAINYYEEEIHAI